MHPIFENRPVSEAENNRGGNSRSPARAGKLPAQTLVQWQHVFVDRTLSQNRARPGNSNLRFDQIDSLKE
jgi:hypothetical protein